MLKMRSAVLIPIVLASGLAMGCGGDDDDDGNGDGGGVRTSVDGSKQVDSLTDSEMATLCRDLDDYFTSDALESAFQDAACRLTAPFGAFFMDPSPATDAELRAACQRGYDECVRQEGAITHRRSCTPPSGTCTATVSEVMACARTYPAFLKQLGEVPPSCNELELSGPTVFSGEPPMTPGACASVTAKCPEFLSDPTEM